MKIYLNIIANKWRCCKLNTKLQLIWYHRINATLATSQMNLATDSTTLRMSFDRPLLTVQAKANNNR